ncbi:MAG: pirin family protein [Chitinophagaceae bacterium]|nr:MAG: pirin family protein [Chitinophagaceae bacterium]
MKTILHKSTTRGHANNGWLDSWHTFSFGSYHDPLRTHFGALRVLNDDTVAAGKGFGKHPHENMEIISIALEGDLKHSDSLGNTAIIKQGDVQIMSAGTGVVHSEKNANADGPVKFLQIWVFPNKQNIKPRYDQKTFLKEERHNNLLTIVSPIEAEDGGVHIHQDAWFSLGNFEKGQTIQYNVKKEGNGVYIFLLEGDVTVNDIVLNRRDGLGVTDENTLQITTNANAELLLMEVPMQ